MTLSSLIDSFNSENEDMLEATKGSIVNILEKGDEKFVSFVQILGPILASANDVERKSGLNLLVLVLTDLPKDFLLEKEVEHLVIFFTERLKDVSHVVPYVVRGLLCLSNFVNLPVGAASKIILCLYHSLHIPTQQQEERYACYSILANLLGSRKHLLELQSQPLAQQSEVILGFLQACDGERDPRCLLLCFCVGKAIAFNFSFGAMSEDFFESFSCYFPVDFKPPDKDGRGITRDDLASGLKECLASSVSFAEFLLPFLLDKMDSTLVLCKLDSFDLLKEISKIYRTENFEPFLPQLWTKLRSDILTTDSKEVEAGALESLSCIVGVLNGNCLVNFISKVWKECEALLDDSSDGLKIVIAVATSSEEAGITILNLSLPLLLSKVNPKSDSSEARKIGALSAICSFLNMDNNKKFAEIWETNGRELISAFFVLWHVSGNAKLLSMRGLTLLLGKCANSWTGKDTELLTQHLLYWTKELESESQATISESWQDLASAIARYNKDLITQKLLALWLQNLDSSVNISKTISLLSSVSIVSDLNSQIFGHVMQKLISQNHSVNHLKYLTQVSSLLRSNTNDKNINSCVTLLIGNSINLISDFENMAGQSNSEEICGETCLVLECLIPSVNIENGTDVLLRIINLFVDENASKKEVFTSLSISSQLLLTDLALSVISHLPKESVNAISINQLCIFTNAICQFANQSTEGLSAKLSQILSCIINKRNNVEQILQSIEETLLSYPSSVNLVTVWVWICKALVLKNYNYKKASQKLMEFLGHEKLGKVAAEGFNTILADSPRVMSTSSGANIQLFYHQRFFTLTQQQLLESYHNATNGDVKNHYLRALSHQLKFLPPAILRKELPPLLPMLISSLSNEHNDLLISILGSLNELLKTDVELARKHLSSLINRLTTLTNEHPNMLGRILALECLLHLATLPSEDILLASNDVLQKLRPCLDDRKRLVRKQASATISKWYMIGNSKDQ